MGGFTGFVQFIVTIIAGMYFYARLKSERDTEKKFKSDYKNEAEQLNRMRHIHLSEPMTESVRPSQTCQIIGQEDGLRALRAA